MYSKPTLWNVNPITNVGMSKPHAQIRDPHLARSTVALVEPSWSIAFGFGLVSFAFRGTDWVRAVSFVAGLLLAC